MRVSLRTPSIPNFIRTDDGRVIPVQNFDDKTLRALAKNWTALLLLSARNKRRAKKGEQR